MGREVQTPGPPSNGAGSGTGATALKNGLSLSATVEDGPPTPRSVAARNSPMCTQTHGQGVPSSAASTRETREHLCAR